MIYRCNCCHRRFGVRLVFYGSETYCESCLTLKVQEDLDYMCDTGFMEKVEGGYQLTEKGRAWPEGAPLESDGAEFTTAPGQTASESTTQERTE